MFRAKLIGDSNGKSRNVKWLANALKFGFHAYAIKWQIFFDDFLHQNLDPPVGSLLIKMMTDLKSSDSESDVIFPKISFQRIINSRLPDVG